MAAATKPPPSDDTPEQPSKAHARRIDAVARKEREEEAERKRKGKEERDRATVARAAHVLIGKAGINTNGLVIARSINDYKFRVNYYLEHEIVWTRCLVLKADGIVEPCTVQ